MDEGQTLGGPLMDNVGWIKDGHWMMKDRHWMDEGQTGYIDGSQENCQVVLEQCSLLTENIKTHCWCFLQTLAFLVPSSRLSIQGFQNVFQQEVKLN